MKENNKTRADDINIEIIQKKIKNKK